MFELRIIPIYPRLANPPLNAVDCPSGTSYYSKISSLLVTLSTRAIAIVSRTVLKPRLPALRVNLDGGGGLVLVATDPCCIRE